MGKFIDYILRNPVTFEIISLFVYAFYCLVFAVSALPSALIISRGIWLLGYGVLGLFVFIVLCFISLYIFVICAAIFVGFTERLLTLGFKPGAYEPGSTVVLRWLIYSGLHLWLVYLSLSFIRGNNWIKIYLRIAGAKVGKEVFINTREFYDPYLLTIGDRVLVGGEAFVNCHLFEGGHLVLGKIVLGDDMVVGAGAYLTPGTNAAKKSRIGMYTYLRRNTAIAEGETHMTPPGVDMRHAIRQMRR